MGRKGERDESKWTTTVCSICGKEFEHYITQPRTMCSKECKQKYYDAQRILKTCPVCGKEFKPHNRRTLYCGEICYLKGARRKLGEKKKACVVCGAMFIPRDEDGKYCSIRCKNWHK